MGQAAMDTIRSLIKKVTVGPINAKNGYDAGLHGDLAAILGACDLVRRPDLRGSRPPGENFPRESTLCGCGSALPPLLNYY